MTIERRLLTDALATMLATATTSAVTVIDAPIPEPGSDIQSVMPYAVVYPLPGFRFEEQFSEGHSDVTVPYQVTSVGKNRNQAEWMADKVRGVMETPTAHPLVVTGMKVFGRFPDGGANTPTEGGQDLWSVAERFVLRVDTT